MPKLSVVTHTHRPAPSHACAPRQLGRIYAVLPMIAWYSSHQVLDPKEASEKTADGFLTVLPGLSRVSRCQGGGGAKDSVPGEAQREQEREHALGLGDDHL